MSDDDNMYRQLYGQANMLVRKFYMCSDEVKITLFRGILYFFLYCSLCGLSLRKRAYVGFRLHTMIE